MMPDDYHKELRDTMVGCTLIHKKCCKCKQYKSPSGGKVCRATKLFTCKECHNGIQGL